VYKKNFIVFLYTILFFCYLAHSLNKTAIRKILLFWLFSLVFSYSINAQSASTYSFAASTGTYTEVNDATATRLNLVEADSYLSTAQSIGFNFVYEGITYTQFKMGSNGFISLNSSGTATLNTNNFSTANATSRPIIAPLWDDLDGRATGSVSRAYFEVTGTAPNRVLTLEWRNWEWNYASSTPVISFQAKLYETTNIIEFVYRSETGTSSSGSASIGIGSATGSGNNSYLNLTSTTTPAVSSISSVTTLSTKPATGQVYTFTPPTPCSGAPLAGTVSGPASACSGIGFNITATGYSTGVSGMTYRWQTATSATGPWTNTTGTSPASFTATQTSTAFYRLVDTCTNSGIGAESNVISVTIGNASYSSLPFFESFENIWIDGCNTKDIPTNNWRNSPATTDSSWRRDDDAASGGNTAIWGSTTSYMYTPASSNGSRSARFHSGNITAGRRGIFDLYIDCSSGVATKQLSFDYINTSGTDSLVISMSTDGGVSFARLDSITLRTAWTNKLVNFTSTSSTTILRFTATADFGSTDIGLDNVNVVVLNTCSGTPTTGIISSNSTTVCAGSSVSFSSSTYTIATGMTYRWQTSATGSDPWINTTTTTPGSLTFTFSTPVWVRRVDTCTNTGQFAISNAIQISINAATYASLPFTESFEATWIDGCGTTGSKSIPNNSWRNTPTTGNNSWRRNDETTANSGWGSTAGGYTPTFSEGAYSARIHTYSTSTPGSLDVYLDCSSGAASKQLSYDYINTSGSDSLKVFLSTDGGNNFSFIGTKNTTTTTWSSFIVPFTSSSSTTVIRFTAYGDFGSTDIGLDNINVVSVACGSPTGLITSSITATGATLSWTAPASAPSSYEVFYSTTNTAPNSGSTPNVTGIAGLTTNITGLSSATTYFVWIRSNCGGSGNSSWTNGGSFITACVEVSAFSQNFDGVVAGTFPPCWAKVGTTGSTYTQASTVISSPNNLYIYSSSTSNLAIVAMPSVSNASAGTHQLKFKARANFTVGGVIQVGYLTNPTDAATFVSLSSFTTTSTTLVDNFVLSPVNAPGGVTTLAFRHTGSPANSVLIDDVVYEQIPSCLEPTALNASSITTTTATVGWTVPSGTPTSYFWELRSSGAAGSGATGLLNSGNTTQNSVALTSLQSGTGYRFYVKTICSSNTDTSSYTTLNFITLIANDECLSAIAVSAYGETLNVTTVGATQSQAPLLCNGFTSTGAGDIWYKFTTSQAGSLTITTSGLDVVLEAFSGACGSLTSLSCADASGTSETLTLTGLNAATTYYFRVYGYGSVAAGQGSFTMTISGAALPVSITSFKGERRGMQNLLAWATAKEQNNKGFELQRSADGINYSTLSFVNSKAINGNSNTTLDYIFTDNKPFAGNSYYRLKQLDKDGNESLSQVVLIKGAKGTQLDITSIYPNPTTSQLNVVMNAPTTDRVTIVITDVAGKILVQKLVNVVAGDNGIQLDVSKLASGTYIMKALCENGCDSGSKKFMKQ
jgi:hypothetical protein